MDKKVTADTRELPDISQEFKAKKDGDNGPREIRVQHAHGGLKGRWTMNSMTIIMAALAIVTIFVTTISASYYYNNIRQNLYTRVTQSASFINRFLNSSYDQFLSASESFVANMEDKDKLEIQIVSVLAVFCRHRLLLRQLDRNRGPRTPPSAWSKTQRLSGWARTACPASA